MSPSAGDLSGAGTRRARLRVDIAAAARLIAPVWPLERFVAVNPLAGVLDEGFDEAIAHGRRWLGIRGYPGVPRGSVAGRTVLETRAPSVAAEVDELVASWCGRLVAGRAPVGATTYAAWSALARSDRRWRRLTGGGDLPPWAGADAGDVVVDALGRLGVHPEDAVHELRGQLARLPGWAGYARWCDEWATSDDPAPRLALLDLLAIRLTTDAMAFAALGPRSAPSPSASPPSPHPGTDSADREPDDSVPALLAARRGLEAAEQHYRTSLLRRLRQGDPDSDPDPGERRAVAQVVCCIDVRSEPLRRHLEALGPYETFGFAGFFAAPVRYQPLGSTEAYASAPVLVQPDLHVPEAVATSATATATATDSATAPDPGDVAARRRGWLGGRAAVEVASHGRMSMFALAETAGWAMGPFAAARTIRPRHRARHGPSSLGTTVATERIPLDEQATMVEALVRTTGLAGRFAPLVVVCGHRSSTANNPHGAALDCGACGGNPGGPNARTFCAMANDPAVRAELGSRGVVLPTGTWFVPAEHDTTTDDVTILDAGLVPPTHQDVLGRLADDLSRAGAGVSAERLVSLPGVGGPGRRSADWAHTWPEWGLAGNAAMIIGPRAISRGVDLDGRVFLHSYEPDRDQDATALETILTAALVVAHWINAQYYFSTVDPEVYGAGDKALHNPIAPVGVLSGDGGDLRIGLPWQSVAGPEGPYHEPLRLLAIVDAPRDHIDAVIGRNPVVGHLVDGGWIHLVARGTTAAPWWRRRPGDGWEPIDLDPERGQTTEPTDPGGSR